MYSIDDAGTSCAQTVLFYLASALFHSGRKPMEAKSWYPNETSDAATADAIDTEHCTDVYLVPSKFRTLLNQPVLPTKDISSLALHEACCQWCTRLRISYLRREPSYHNYN